MGHRTHPDLTKIRRGMSGAFFLESSPGNEAAPPPGPRQVVQAPASNSSAGRRMTYEEALAQQILRMNQTVSGKNQIANVPDSLPVSSVSDGRQKEGQTRRSRLGFTYMGIQGQAPAQILLPAIAATQTVVSFTCPRRHNGEIEFIANQFVGGGWTEGSGTIIWQILVDGVPVQGYDAILGSLGSTASPGWLGSGEIQFSENQLIQLRCRNVSIAAAGQILLGILRGHFEPIEAKRNSAW